MNHNYTKLKCIILIFVFPLLSFAASHHPQDFLNKIHGKPDEGAQIVKHFCALCHAENPQIPMGAPRIGIKSEWSSRTPLGLQTLYQHVADGYNAMPARGGCFECSDEQLLLAIKAMLAPCRE